MLRNVVSNIRDTLVRGGEDGDGVQHWVVPFKAAQKGAIIGRFLRLHHDGEANARPRQQRAGAGAVRVVASLRGDKNRVSSGRLARFAVAIVGIIVVAAQALSRVVNANFAAVGAAAGEGRGARDGGLLVRIVVTVEVSLNKLLKRRHLLLFIFSNALVMLKSMGEKVFEKKRYR